MTGSLGPSRIFTGLPPHGAGQRIGLYGGSFNPPHVGHRRASLMALDRLGLDRIWWLVATANPLKDAAGLPPQAERMERAAELAAHPRIFISGAEKQLGTRYTADFIRILKQRAQGACFVWLMGSDNLTQFDRWENWRSIARMVPIAVINRPGHLLAPLASRAAKALAAYRVDEADSRTLACSAAPAWIYLTGPRIPVSSTALRSGAMS